MAVVAVYARLQRRARTGRSCNSSARRCSQEHHSHRRLNERGRNGTETLRTDASLPTGIGRQTHCWSRPSRPVTHPASWGIPSTTSASRRSMLRCRICATASRTVSWRLPPSPRSGCSSRMTKALSPTAGRQWQSAPYPTGPRALPVPVRASRRATDRRTSAELLRPQTHRILDRRSEFRPTPVAQDGVEGPQHPVRVPALVLQNRPEDGDGRVPGR